jgi:hypothetical protein
MSNELIGKWAFLIGLIIAVIASFISGYTTIVLLILFILGLVVGFLNIVEKNTIKFLVAVSSLLILGVASISTLSILGIISSYINAILGNFIAFVSAAALVVAIKSIVETSKI